MSDLKFYIMADVGEFECDLQMQESNLTIKEAKKVYADKYNDGQKYGDVFICLDNED